MKQPTLLLVEDDSDVLNINREYLEGKGYRIVEAATLAQAEFLLEERNPDLILLDVMMPDGSGFDFCARLRRTGMMSAGKIELPPLSIDFLSGEAALDGVPIPLTSKELQLLGCFALFAGRRLSYDEIYRRAWGGTSPGAARTIAVHVANLRKKLRAGGGDWFELVNSGKEEYIFSKVRY